MDRIDLHVEVPAVAFRDLAAPSGGEPSAAVRARAQRAADVQAARLGPRGPRFNGRMDPSQVRAHAGVPEEASRLLEAAMDRLGLSARALDRVLKVARTIADLDGADAIRTVHVSEAIQYRVLDRPAA